MSRTAVPFLLFFGLTLVAAGQEVKFVPTDEFNGPFPSWRDVKRDYGAKGDGMADDSDAINRALADLKKEKREFCVLYFPTGTYRITKTVTTSPCKTHHEGSGIAVVGEDPATTIIKWDGSDKGIVFSYTAWYSRIERLTIDGSRRAGVALLYNGEKFSTYNETADIYVKDAEVGMKFGGLGGDCGQAENMVHRCRFLNCETGLETASFNTLDIWVWDGLFQDCGTALFNRAGDFRAYSCIFLRSKKRDVFTTNLSSFSFTSNVSIGSAMFLDFTSQPGGLLSSAPISMCWNRIYDWTGNQGAVQLGGGPTLLWGNVFRNRASDQTPAVCIGGYQAFFGNVYSAPVPRAIPSRPNLNGAVYRPRMIIGDDMVVPRDSIADPKLRLPAAPPRIARKVFEVAAGSDAAAIQAAIDAAAALKSGQRPVVHLPKGVCKIKKTLVVPAETNLQIVGDAATEAGSSLLWTGAKGEYVVRVEGPGNASLRDLFINNGSGKGIVFENCDRDGGCFYADRLNSGTLRSGRAVRVEGMDQSRVQFRCLAWGDGSFRVSRGAAAAGAGPVKGVTSVFGGTSGDCDDKVFDIGPGATAVLSGVYYDAAGVIQIVSMTGNGNLLYDNGIFAAGSSPKFPMLKFQDFSGRALITTAALVECIRGDSGPRLHLEGNCSRGSVLLFGTSYQANSYHDIKDLFVDNSTPKCPNAGVYLSTFQSPALPSQSLRPDDVAPADAKAPQPGLAIARSLSFFGEASKPRTPGMDDDQRPRLHTVIVKVHGDTGVLIQGGK